MLSCRNISTGKCLQFLCIGFVCNSFVTMVFVQILITYNNERNILSSILDGHTEFSVNDADVFPNNPALQGHGILTRDFRLPKDVVIRIENSGVKNLTAFGKLIGNHDFVNFNISKHEEGIISF